MNAMEAVVPPVGVLPDVVPSVSFDIRLKNKVDHIDFDYNEYDCQLQQGEANLDPSQIAETSINFTTGISLLNAGYADFDNKHIQVSLGLFPRESKTNKTLKHETQHMIDYTAGKLTDRERKINIAAQRLRTIGFIGCYGSVPLSAMGIAAENTIIGEVGLVVAGVGTATLGAAMGLYYGASSLERSARQAQKVPGKVVSITKKQKLAKDA